MPDSNANNGEVRVGALVLARFVNPLNAQVLRAHAEGPQRLAGVTDRLPWVAATTLRVALTDLRKFGALRKCKAGGSRFPVETELTALGEEMLYVADVIEAWLALSPDGPIAADSEEAKAAIKALAGGWNSTLMRAMASRSLSLTELAGVIPDLSYSTLERRISWMRAIGQIEPVEAEGRTTPYVVTNWLRHAIAPLCAAGRCERRHMDDESSPITSIEVEASFLLATPLAPLAQTASGTCMLAGQIDPAEPDEKKGSGLAGVTVEVERGQILSCGPQVSAEPSTWAVGTPEALLDVVIDGRIDDLRIGGANPQLALDLVTGIHQALFGNLRAG